MKRAVVVGAGLAGLTVARKLTDAGIQTLLVERGPVVGGNCRSFRYGAYTFDVGIHCFDYAQDEATRFVLGHCRDRMVPIKEKKAACYFRGAIRPELGALRIRYLPVRVLVRGAWDFFRRKRPRDLRSLGECAASYYGNTFSEILVKQRIEKLARIPWEQTHVDFGKFFWLAPPAERLSLIVAAAAVGRKIVARRSSSATGDGSMAAFFPSPGGFGDFCERLADRVVKGGGELLTNAAIEHIDLDGSVVRSVGVNGRTERADWLIWTGDLGVLCRLLGIPADLAFPFLNVVLFNLEVTGSATHDYLWVEYADPACLVDRACLNNLYRPLNAPPGYHGVSAEVWCRADHEVWKDPESFVGEVQENLVRAGVVASRDRVVGCHIERIPRVWPILGLDYRERLERAMALVLARARNLYLTNRAGAGFQTLDRVIESALAVSGTICHGAGSNDPWASDGTHRRCAE